MFTQKNLIFRMLDIWQGNLIEFDDRSIVRQHLWMRQEIDWKDVTHLSVTKVEFVSHDEQQLSIFAGNDLIASLETDRHYKPLIEFLPTKFSDMKTGWYANVELSEPGTLFTLWERDT